MSFNWQNPVTPLFSCQDILVLDGAFSTEVEKRLAPSDSFNNDPLWSARLLLDLPSFRSLIYQLHMDYLCAGADIITSGTYQASIQAFIKHTTFAEATSKGLQQARPPTPLTASQAIELFHASVQIAKDARDDYYSSSLHHHPHTCPHHKPLVAASLGPYGVLLADGSEYSGHYATSGAVTQADMRAFHRDRIWAVWQAQPDLVAFESVPSVQEAVAIVEMVAAQQDDQQDQDDQQEWIRQVPIWISFTCKDPVHISDGTVFAEAIHRVQQKIVHCNAFNVVALGINCTPPQYIQPLLQSVSTSTSAFESPLHLPLIVYPNSGEVWDAHTKSWAPAPKDFQFEILAMKWKEAGAKIIGGCCRTTPLDIQKMVSLKKMRHDRT